MTSYKSQVFRIVARRSHSVAAASFFILLIACGFLLMAEGEKLASVYRAQFSPAVSDRHGTALRRYPNDKGHYSFEQTEMPEALHALLIRKEDRFFYYHPGINPASMARALASRIVGGHKTGGSTVTQQLAKILLGNEQKRTVWNKAREMKSAFALELRFTKKEILTMYENVAYLGNQAQGFAEGSMVYFGKPIQEATDAELLSLISTLGSPSSKNPWKKENARAATFLAENLAIATSSDARPKREKHVFQKPSALELDSLGIVCNESCATTLDGSVEEALRSILARHLKKTAIARGENGAIVVITTPRNELLALVGSPDPNAQSGGAQINMALEPRPVGSTMKPFIYLEGFARGLRPYTIVEDREYKYPIATGHPLYPKNYDGAYRGEVTLHEALSNSLNVPSVKVLEYIGLTNFYNFLLYTLQFLPLRDLDTYQYGIALGGLEMDLLTLAQYYTIFPNRGMLSPLSVIAQGKRALTVSLPPQATIQEARKIADPRYTELVTKILSDRSTGVEQFGLVGNLTLSQSNYAVKTGTSRDFHDSWVVGYTPDFVLGVWLGNSENRPLIHLSGQSGAGAIWHDAMEYLFTTPYNKKTPFSFSETIALPIDNSVEFGLPGENPADHRELLTQDTLILSPYTDDTFEFETRTTIPLVARRSVRWSANGAFIGSGEKIFFRPTRAGNYEIMAKENNRREIIQINIVAGRGINRQ